MANNLVFAMFQSKSYLSESADELDSMTIKISKMLYNKLRTCLQLLDAARPETSKLTVRRRTRWAIVKQTWTEENSRKKTHQRSWALMGRAQKGMGDHSNAPSATPRGNPKTN